MTDLERWRLVLGHYAERRLGQPQGAHARCDAALDQLYGREYGDRGVRPHDPDAGPRSGSLDSSAPTIVDWLGEVRDLFPQPGIETLERHALQRYGLTELVTDPQVLARLEPSEELLKTLLSLSGRLHPQVLDEVRRIIRVVVERLRRRLESEMRPALTGRVSHHRHSPRPATAAFDPRGTIRANLQHWDADRRRLLVERPLFFQRNHRRIPWEVVLLVDQSGSMAGSVVHSAVVAGILTALPTFRLRMVVFDTSVVDLTHRVGDPVELLLSVQLGGGTDIAQALTHAATLVDDPTRSVVVLVTDFCEGGPPSALVAAVRRLVEARVTTIGLTCLDGSAHPPYDRQTAQWLADAGMPIAALTPSELADWLAQVTSR